MLPAEPGVVAMAEDGEFVELFSRVELAGQAPLRQVRKTELFARTEGYGLVDHSVSLEDHSDG